MQSTNAKHSKYVMRKSTPCKGEKLHLPSSCMSYAVSASPVTYYSAHFCLLKSIFIFCTMARGKHAPEGECKPSRKLTAIDLQIKI